MVHIFCRNYILRFQGLDLDSKLNCLTIKDKKFITGLIGFLPNHNHEKIYNMKTRKYLRNIEVSEKSSSVEKGLSLILQNLQIAFFKEPVLHLSKNTEFFLCNELIKWMEIISHQKIFQFANKIKQSEALEDNILWFNQNSFHKLEAFFVNEFEKAILKSYFNRDRIQSNYLLDIKDFCKIQKDNFKNKNIESELISFPLAKAPTLGQKDVEIKISEMKEIQEKYEREKQRLIQKLLDDQVQTKDSAKKKRKRIRKKFKPQEPQQTQEEKQPQKVPQKQKPAKPKQTQKPQKPKQKKFQYEEPSYDVQQEQKASFGFNDQISQISKCQDSEFHETDVTFQKYFENENISIPEPQIPAISFKSYDNIQNLKNEQIDEETITKPQKNQDKIEANQMIAEQMIIEESDQNTEKSSMSKQKKKTKKQKMLENLQNNLIKSIRNNAFTEFIDTISIESNNLYNYKLSAYQFIVFFISSLLPTTNITLFGSNAVGLSLASSDIDIMISNSRWSNLSQVREVLYHIGNQISKMGWVVDFRLILNAKVPVLKLFIDPKIQYFDLSPLKYGVQTNLMESVVIKADIIINIEGEQNIGCQSTLLMKEWLTDHPQLQRIILFFKYVLWYYGLNENYRGGICSYCLFIMVVNCLFKRIEVTSDKDIFQVLQDEDQGTYIIQILKYYSQTFDPKVDEISITKGLKVSSSVDIRQKDEDKNVAKRNLTLKVIDPINGQYIQSSFGKFSQVQQLFSMILTQSLKSDEQLKRHINAQQEINEQFSKSYISLSQPNNTINVITKNMDQVSESKMKKFIKKASYKLKKTDEVKYSVKEIVSIGFRIGIQNWMSSPTNNFSQERFNI